ncbi:MAG TPA: hypothetical protein VK635_19340 [Bradyrhizobium sp.]|jgi:hypothetical protein|nr:hypothetical protein [Bradyrhizobium sp.]
MMKIPDSRRGLVRSLGLAAAAMLMLSAATSERAEALSPINPASAPAAKHASDGLTTEVRGGHGGHGGGHGGGHHGGGFHGGGRGGFHGGGAAFHGGGFRSGHVFHGGFRHGGHRFAHRHHFHRRFYYAPSYYYHPHRCRVVWTYYGPRRICRYRPWHHHHWRHHHRHYRYW